MKLRIHFLIATLRGGGAERVCVTVANALVKLGMDVHLAVLNLGGSVHQKSLDPRVRLSVLGVNHARQSVGCLARYLRQERPEVVLVFDHQLALVLTLLRQVCCWRYAVIARNINTLSRQCALEESFWHKHIVTFIVKRFYQQTDRIIAQSQGMAEDLIADYKLLREKIVVINNPVSSAIEQAARAGTLDLPKNQQVLFAGRLAPQKGLDHLLRAFALCLAQAPDATLRIVGDGPLRDKLISQIKELKVEHAVRIEGFTLRIADCYRQARVVALTSMFEGFPNVLVEALTMGRPVVAFDCPSGPSEIIVDGVNGFLVPLGNDGLFARRLAEALDKNWDPQALRQSVARFAAENIMQDYQTVIGAFISRK